MQSEIRTVSRELELAVCPEPVAARSLLTRLLMFGSIGMFVFLVGTALQWVLLKPLGANSSYVWQTMFSVELSYVLNRWLTWPDRHVPILSSLVKWNAQKLVLTVPNIVCYDLLMQAGMNWLTANLAATAAFAVVNYVAADKWTFAFTRGYRSAMKRILALRATPLLLILGVQAGLSLRLVWANTASGDEALYLWAGRLELAHWLHGGPLPSGGNLFSTYFSGAPVIYPPLGALANDVGGLAGARILSLCFLLGTTALLYSVTYRLFDRRAAIVAAAVFACLGMTECLGPYATYDAMALFLLALASWFAIRSGDRWGELALIACALTLVLADATKYASMLWNPVVIALAVLGPAGSTRLAAAGRGIRLTIYGMAVALPLLFLVGGHNYVTGLVWTTLSRGIPGTNPPLGILTSAFNWIGIVLLLALTGFILSFSADDKRVRWLCGILVGAALLAPLNQARIDTATSLQKHVVFGAWFAAIVVGYGLSRISDRSGAKIRRLLAVVVVVVLWFGVSQASMVFTGWPNSAGITNKLSAAVSRSECPCLITQSTVASYYLPRLGAYVPISTYKFYYYDKLTRQELIGLPAYEAAIKAGYFGVIEMDGYNTVPSTFTTITRILASDRDYTLFATIPASNQQQPFRIWIRK